MNNKMGKDHYINSSYLSFERFSSFYYQVTETLSFNPISVVEVGIGSRLVSLIINEMGIRTTMVDLDVTLHPNVVGSIQDLPLKASSADVVICCQVLEHLPFQIFPEVIKEIARVAKKGIVLSLPDVEPFYSIHAQVPILGNIKTEKSGKRIKRLSNERMNRSHYWEIGRENINEKKILEILISNNLKIIRNYRNVNNPYHHFFVIGNKSYPDP